MSLTIRAHFDGTVIVPDEPLDLPIDQPLELELTVPAPESLRPFVVPSHLLRNARSSSRKP